MLPVSSLPKDFPRGRSEAIRPKSIVYEQHQSNFPGPEPVFPSSWSYCPGASRLKNLLLLPDNPCPSACTPSMLNDERPSCCCSLFKEILEALCLGRVYWFHPGMDPSSHGFYRFFTTARLRSTARPRLTWVRALSIQGCGPLLVVP